MAGFFAIFPKPVPRVEDLGGKWRLLLLDSNLKGVAWGRQMMWLDGMLGSSRDECLIAAWHHPRWSSGKHGDGRFVDPVWRRVSGYVTRTLHGHDHHFEALPQFDAEGAVSLQGTASFVVGTGGARLYQAGESKRSERTVYEKFGFLRISLEGTRYHWRFIGVDDKVLSSGSGTCQPTGGRPYLPARAPIDAAGSRIRRASATATTAEPADCSDLPRLVGRQRHPGMGKNFAQLLDVCPAAGKQNSGPQMFNNLESYT